MVKSLGYLFLLLSVLSICKAAIFSPISGAHRSAALELFNPTDVSFGSLEEAYQSLRTFEILGIEKPDIQTSTCKSVVDVLWTSSSALKDLFYALRVNGLLKCKLNNEAFEGIASRLKDSVSDANSLLDFYYAIGSLVLIKDQASEADVLLEDANSVFRSIKALSQSDGRWRYSSDKPESSTYAAGIALETIAGVVSLASSEINQSLVNILKNDILKLFDAIERYDDGALYFDEKFLVHGQQGPLSATSSVVRGMTAFANASSGSLNLSGDKILGLAKFFLSVGIPGSAQDLYYQTDALSCLEKNRQVNAFYPVI